MVRVGLVGCGTIGSQLAKALERTYRQTARITALLDSDSRHARALQQQLRSHPPIVSLARLIQRSDLVVEAASAEVVGEVVRRALRADRSVFVMSVGGLLADQHWPRLVRRSRGRIYIPSGALAGLDGVKAMALGRIRRVSLTSRKPPKALACAPYVQRRKLSLSHLARPTVVFEGSPQAVVKAFPQNTNIAAALTLAMHQHPNGTGDRRTSPIRVRIVADQSQEVVDIARAEMGPLHVATEAISGWRDKTHGNIRAGGFCTRSPGEATRRLLVQLCRAKNGGGIQVRVV